MGCEERSAARKDLRLITAVSAVICVPNDMEPYAVRSPAEAHPLDTEPSRARRRAPIAYSFTSSTTASYTSSTLGLDQ